MKRLDFICTFKSDIVLHASSNTEGKVEKLDYIPGSNFLGMVARDYAGFGADAFDVFHSGEVCFGDGHMLVGDEPTLHVPYSFQAFKGVSFEKARDDGELFVHHLLTKGAFEKATADSKQYKQQRVGFFTASGEYAKLEHSYRQKSAYDKNKRRSRDSGMFGYHALPAESRWAFSVTIGSSMTKHEEKIKALLTGKKRLGKSKSAEYGLVKIEFAGSTDVIGNASIALQEIADEKKYLYLYAKSRLVLTDKHGINSYIPSIESLGFDKGDNVKIDWHKSQIRTSRYTPYVGARQNFDPERLVINKGSVIVVEVPSGFDTSTFAERIQRPIGLYISEGHGEVLVNPKWLLSKDVSFTGATSDVSAASTSNFNNTLNKWLEAQRESQEKEATLLSEVFAFIKSNNVKYKKSQWGQIRSLCRQAKDSDALYNSLFAGDRAFLTHGKALKKWDSKLIESIKSKKGELEDDYKKFVTLLSIYAPKEDDKASNTDEGGA